MSEQEVGAEQQVEILRSYLGVAGAEIKELAWEGLEALRAAESEEAAAVTRGYITALYKVIEFMRRQADAYGLAYREIGLDGIDPEKDLRL
jgi:hypothetical protein